MLYKYNRDDNQKIAMGFLSYISDLKDMSNLEQELKLYDEDENRQLYLWKSKVEDFSGIVALSFTKKTVFIEYISLNPSYRSQTNTFRIFDDIQRKFPEYKILGSFGIVDQLRKWYEQRNKEKTESK
ncbi:RibT protein [Companilactobacillus mishanensis]|uniref:RibT protein n=1 Tax=Companilactobacillus mishanensis TaxID=2486008 RepID=A0A5P0ZFA4_9LACO|nr:RibT protein [Companilactobacillus mishanensis]MQS51722.1 RibT protein [Companilactobacillus mishanensis]